MFYIPAIDATSCHCLTGTLLGPLTWVPLWQQQHQRQRRPQLPPLQQQLQQPQHYSGWPLTSGLQKPQLWSCCLRRNKSQHATVRRDEGRAAAHRRGEENKTWGLTHSTQRTNSSIILSWQVLLVAHGAHAVSPGVAIKTTASGTEDRNWALIGLLGHSGISATWWADLETDIQKIKGIVTAAESHSTKTLLKRKEMTMSWT